MKIKAEICLTYTLVALLIFILSYNSIWIIDSITYQYNFATGDKIRNIGDIFESQYVHYFTWNGRYVAHWLCQLFLPLLGKGVFSTVNALMYVALIRLVVKITTKVTVTISRIVTATLLVLLFCDTNYTPPFQIGYIWMAVLVLTYIHVFFNYAKYEKPSLAAIVGLSLFSFITGNGQEAINVGMGGALIIFALIHIRRLTFTQWCMVICFGIGGLFLCLAPGTIGRTEEMVTNRLYSLVNLFLSLRVTYIFISIFICKLARKRISLKNFYDANAFFINAMVILIVFNMIIGVGGTRQLFGIELFACILTIRLLKDQSFRTEISVIFSIMIIGIYTLKYVEIRKAERTYNEIYEKISANPEGPIFIDFPRFNPYVHSTAVFRYGVYLDYALASIAQSQKGSVINECIPCYPKKVEELLKQPADNQAYEYLPGEYILMQSKEKPEQFTLHRSIYIMGVRIPLAPYQVEFDFGSRLNTDDYNILFLPCILPIIKNDNITIERVSSGHNNSNLSSHKSAYRYMYDSQTKIKSSDNG